MNRLLIRRLRRLGTVAAATLLAAIAFGCDSGEPNGQSASEEQASTGGTSSEAPLPAGSAAEIGDWTITPSNLKLDAVSEGDLELWGELTPGRQIVSYDVEGTYSGTGVVSLVFEVEVGIWADGAFYSETCEAVLPGYWADAPDVEGGGTASGVACAEIPDHFTDTTDLLFYVTGAEGLSGSIYYIEVD